MNARFAVLALALTALGAPSIAASEKYVFDLTINAGTHPRSQSLVVAKLDLSDRFAGQATVSLVDAAGHSVPAQLTRPNVISRPPFVAATFPFCELHFVVADLPAHGTRKLTATVTDAASGAVNVQPAASFVWIDTAGVSTELRYGAKPVLRYMYEALDESTPERRAETYKVYHHVFDPSGKTLLTKGPGGLYPHHRGLFYGFNRISDSAGRKADTWHCTDGAYLAHDAFVEQEAGPVLGRHRVSVHWHGQAKELIAHELREMSAYQFPDGTLIEFASRLQTTIGGIKLDGDPQHAGFQFRAAQEVADVTNKETYYIRPFGKGAPGETLNWPEAKEMINLPWHAMSCVMGGQRYTIARLDHPRNPRESRFSERDYGRFGSYFEYDLDVGNPLDLRYRVWVQAGEMTAMEIEAKSRDFIEPIELTVTPR